MSSCIPNKGFMSASDASAFTKLNASVWQEICAIQQHIINASTGVNKSNCINITGNTPFTYYPRIESVTVVDAGTGYQESRATATIERVQTDEIYLIDDLFLSTEMENAHLVASVNQSGGIQAVSVIKPGTSYTEVDQVVVSHPVGSGFSGNLVLDASGGVTSVSVSEPGEDYQSIPVSISIQSEYGTGALFDIDLTPGGSISAVNVVDGGQGYSGNVQLGVVSFQGSGAKVLANVSPNNYNVDAYKYYLAFTGSSPDRQLQGHLNQVISYFSGLGYKIKLFSNPEVPGTLMWNVCWC